MPVGDMFNSSSLRSGRHTSFVSVAEHAAEFNTEHFLPARFGNDPWAALPGRIVTHVLSVSAGQLGDPVAIDILIKPCDRLFHD
jgi:hypothetical protein